MVAVNRDEDVFESADGSGLPSDRKLIQIMYCGDCGCFARPYELDTTHQVPLAVYGLLNTWLDEQPCSDTIQVGHLNAQRTR